MFTIVEAGINWFGDTELAKEMIRFAAKVGASMVKFQLYRPKELLGENSPYLRDALKGVPTMEQCKELFDFATLSGIEFGLSVFHPDYIDFLENLGLKRYKVASRSVSNFDLLKEINKTQKPVIMSTGLSTDDEIFKALEVLKDCDVSLLYCIPKYPPDYNDFNPWRIEELKKLFGRPVGFSSHYPYLLHSLLAVGHGATLLENHLVMDRNSVGCDVGSSITPEQYRAMMKWLSDHRSRGCYLSIT